MRRLVLVPRGAFVSGVVTGQLLDADGSLVGIDSRRATLAVDLRREGDRYVPVARAFRLDLMGIMVEVEPAVLTPALALPWRADRDAARDPHRVSRLREVNPS